MPQIRHKLDGSFLKKIKIKSEASAGRPAFSVGTGGGPEEPEAFFSSAVGALPWRRGPQVSRAGGWGGEEVGVGHGATREAASSLESGRSAQASGRRRDSRSGAENGRSGVLRQHAQSLAVYCQYPAALGFYLKKKITRVLAEKGRRRTRVLGPFPGQRVGLALAPATELGKTRREVRIPTLPILRPSGRASFPGFRSFLCEMGSSFRPRTRPGCFEGTGFN